MELMMEIAKQPFTKLRCAVFNVVCAIATQPWGQKTMNGHPGFNEYLLDRTTETEKSTKEGKYSIVVTLVDSPTAPDIYGHEYFLKLRLYHREGAYYVKVETAVAMESAWLGRDSGIWCITNHYFFYEMSSSVNIIITFYMLTEWLTLVMNKTSMIDKVVISVDFTSRKKRKNTERFSILVYNSKKWCMIHLHK